MNESQLSDELKKYNFYHIIKLTENLSTPGCDIFVPIQEIALKALKTINLENKRVLDIGCRDGLFSFEAEKLGAQEVIGIDNDLSLGAVNLLIPYLKSKVKMYELNLLDLKPETFGLFDLVIFPGVLYHLRYPFWALKLIKDVLHDGGQLIIETAVFMDDNQRAILFCPVGSDSPYEDTSCTFFNIKGLSDTLSSLGFVIEKMEVLSQPEKLDDVNWLSSIKSRLRIFQPVKPSIARATFVCSKQAQLKSTPVNDYWNSTHKLETQPLG